MSPDDWHSWDREYRKKGSLWCGSPRSLPDLPAGAVRVLELGCGNGKTLAGMLGRGWTVVATDFSPAAVQMSCRIIRSDPACEAVISDARQLPFCSGCFDAVVASHLLGHLDAHGRAVAAREIERLLTPNGQVIFSDFSINDLRYGTGTETEPGTFVRGNGIATHYFSKEEVAALFPVLRCEVILEHTWPMRIRGQSLVRSEIHASLVKSGR